MVSTEWSHTTKRLVVVGLIIVLLLTLYLFRAIIPPVAIAFVLSYLLKPIVDYLERRLGLPRTLGVLFIVLVLLLAIIAIPVAVVPNVVGWVARLNLDLQRLTDDVVVFLSQPVTVLAFSFNPQDLVGDVRGTIQDLVQPFATQTVTLLVGVASSVVWVVATAVISFYLIRDAGRLREFLDRLAPPGYTEELRRLREEINLVW